MDGITYIGDESNREGMRINIELRRDVKCKCYLKSAVKAYTVAGYIWCDHVGPGEQ